MEIYTYKTKDLFESALLYCMYANDFVGLEPDGRDYLFVFSGKECQKTAQDYYARRANVDAKTYSDAIRNCKDLIFSQFRERGLR